MDWFNLKSRPFHLPTEPDKWYNLSTNREIGIHHQKLNDGYSFRGIPIIGTVEELTLFWTLNIPKLQTIYPKGTNANSVVYKPVEDIRERSIAAVQTCQKGKSGTIIFTKSNNIDDISDEDIKKMCIFTFAGLQTKCKVVNIVDGDTFDLLTFVPLVILVQHGAVAFPETTQHLSGSLGFSTIIRVRLLGYDAVEHTHLNSPLAIKLLTDYLASLPEPNKVWTQFTYDEKYGRSLAVLWGDQYNGKMLVNEFLLNESKRLGIILATPYQGGTKTLAPK
jgi:endonuclease YncB( thermonuclease family)